MHSHSYSRLVTTGEPLSRKGSTAGGQPYCRTLLLDGYCGYLRPADAVKRMPPRHRLLKGSYLAFLVASLWVLFTVHPCSRVSQPAFPRGLSARTQHSLCALRSVSVVVWFLLVNPLPLRVQASAFPGFLTPRTVSWRFARKMIVRQPTLLAGEGRRVVHAQRR